VGVRECVNRERERERERERRGGWALTCILSGGKVRSNTSNV